MRWLEWLRKPPEIQPTTVQERSEFDARVAKISDGISSLISNKAELDLLWGVLFRGALSEAIVTGVLLDADAMEISGTAKAQLSEQHNLVREISSYFNSTGRFLSDQGLFIAIEHRWGKRIVESICLPLGLTSRAGVITTLYYVKRLSAELYPTGLLAEGGNYGTG